MVQKVKERVKIEDILMAHNCMKDIVIKTPLQRDTVYLRNMIVTFM